MDYIHHKDSWGLIFAMPSSYSRLFLHNLIDIEEDEYNFEMDTLMNQMLIDKIQAYNKVKFYLRGDNVNDYKFQKANLEKQFSK